MRRRRLPPREQLGYLGERRQYLYRSSCAGLVVLLDEAAEAVTAVNVERAMWPLTVLVVDEDAEDVLEVAAVEDPALAEVETEVARLLGHPLAVAPG